MISTIQNDSFDEPFYMDSLFKLKLPLLFPLDAIIGEIISNYRFNCEQKRKCERDIQLYHENGVGFAVNTHTLQADIEKELLYDSSNDAEERLAAISKENVVTYVDESGTSIEINLYTSLCIRKTYLQKMESEKEELVRRMTAFVESSISTK